MTPREIIDTAIEYRLYYNTRNARYVAERMGILVTESNFDPKYFQAHIIRNIHNVPVIAVNNHYTKFSQNVLCAHELGHAILHSGTYNQFAITTDHIKQQQEYEANLFAVAFLCNESDFDKPLTSMNNYMLKSILDVNLHLKNHNVK